MSRYASSVANRHLDCRCNLGWLRSVGSIRLYVSFAEYHIFYRALLQKRPMILRSLLIVKEPTNRSHPIGCKRHACLLCVCVCVWVCVCVCACVCVRIRRHACLLQLSACGDTRWTWLLSCMMVVLTCIQQVMSHIWISHVTYIHWMSRHDVFTTVLPWANWIDAIKECLTRLILSVTFIKMAIGAYEHGDSFNEYTSQHTLYVKM